MALLELYGCFYVYYVISVSKIRKQHALAVDILTRLGRGLDTIRLEAEGNGHYLYRAWNTPIVEHNGSRTVKRGKIRISPS